MNEHSVPAASASADTQPQIITRMPAVLADPLQIGMWDQYRFARAAPGSSSPQLARHRVRAELAVERLVQQAAANQHRACKQQIEGLVTPNTASAKRSCSPASVTSQLTVESEMISSVSALHMRTSAAMCAKRIVSARTRHGVSTWCVSSGAHTNTWTQERDASGDQAGCTAITVRDSEAKIATLRPSETAFAQPIKHVRCGT